MRSLTFKKSVRIKNKLKIENLRRILFLKFFFKKLILKAMYYNNFVTQQQKMLILYKKTYFNRYASETQQKIKCIQTGKSNMPFRLCLLGRINFKNFSKLSYIPHVVKYIK